MNDNLNLYERFVLIVQAKTLDDALEIADGNIILNKIVLYLSTEYLLYEKGTN